ncbi:MAG: hypothetical protein U0361_10915 [Nitrospiraceae bacterium]
MRWRSWQQGRSLRWGAALYTDNDRGGRSEAERRRHRRLVGGLAFSLGLILVVVGGAELFTATI